MENRTTCCVLAALSVFAASILPASAGAWFSTGQKASRPIGHVEYCNKNKSDCGSRKATSSLPPSRMSVLNKVNKAVNRAITPAADSKVYGKREYWTANARAGDCEDFALMKRNKLLRSGFRYEHLLLAMGYSGGEAHTVLVVRTRDGDFILDNKTDAVLSVNQARFRAVKIQSPTNGGSWLKVTGKTAQSPA